MIKQWWDKITGKQEREELRAQMETIVESFNDIQNENQQLKQHNENLEERVEILTEQASRRKEIQQSTDPYIEIVSDEYDSEKGLRLSLDWNPAFIEFLKENGIQGTNEEEIVKRYLAYLYLDVAQRMEEKK